MIARLRPAASGGQRQADVSERRPAAVGVRRYFPVRLAAGEAVP
jgi:hypothetical protein